MVTVTGVMATAMEVMLIVKTLEVMVTAIVMVVMDTAMQVKEITVCGEERNTVTPSHRAVTTPTWRVGHNTDISYNMEGRSQ